MKAKRKKKNKSKTKENMKYASGRDFEEEKSRLRYSKRGGKGQE